MKIEKKIPSKSGPFQIKKPSVKGASQKKVKAGQSKANDGPNKNNRSVKRKRAKEKAAHTQNKGWPIHTKKM